MGSTRWSDDDYEDRAKVRTATAAPTFVHDHNIRTGKTARAAHKSLCPLGVKVRECRDSVAHPNSRPIITILDETGSMQVMPKIAQKTRRT